MFDFIDPVKWAFLQNYHLDKSNACVHCSPVRFSPLTFRLFETLMNLWPEDEDIIMEMYEVRSHRGTYAEDRGRVAEE